MRGDLKDCSEKEEEAKPTFPSLPLAEHFHWIQSTGFNLMCVLHSKVALLNFGLALEVTVTNFDGALSHKA